MHRPARLLVPLAGVAVAAALAVALGAALTARDDPVPPGVPVPGRPAPAPSGADRRGLAAGDVVLRVGPDVSRSRTTALAEALAGGPPEALRGTGQAVVVRAGERRGITARAYRRALAVRAPQDPRLRAFVEHWLGRGAAG